MGRGGGSGRAKGGDGGALSRIPADFRPAKLGAMRIDGSARNEELTNFLEAHPNAKLTNIPITPALREKVLGHVEAWQRSNPSEVAKVRSILSADTLPPPIVQFYSSGNVGIPDGFHRIAAYILSGRTSIRGYAIGTPPKS